jgi:glycosyltransferase involved in cell wall biosynthesis
MKVLVLTNKPPYPPKDGGAIAVFNLAKGLADNGNLVHILSLNTSKHKVEINKIPHFNNLSFTYVNIDTSIRISALFKNLCFSKLPYNAERFISQDYLNTLEQILKSETFDFVQLEGPYMAFCIDTVRRFSKAKISLRSHNIEHEIWQRTAFLEKNIVKKIYLRHLSKRIKNLEKSLHDQYDCLLPITMRDGQLLDKIGNKKPSFVVPVGIDTTTISQEDTNDYNSVFYIGALDWIPNQEGLQWFVNKVWPLVVAANNNIILHIAGRNAPQWLIENLRFKNIQFHGEVDNAYHFMENKGIMIVPLFSGSGMRVKIIEGMALGKAIITTPIGAEGIDVTDGENIYIAENADLFVKKLINLLNNATFAKSISEQAKIFIQNNYDNSVIAKKLLEFYSNQLSC